MDLLLRKKDLVEALGVAKSTIADWVTEFHIFIPTVKQGAVTYYKPETIDVLKAIKELRERDYAKPQIMELLAKKGFPITVEEAVEDVERVLTAADSRDTLLTVMQTVGQAIVEIGNQDGRINRVETRFEEYSKRIDGQDGRIDEQGKQIGELVRRLAEAEERAVKAEAAVAAAQAEAKKTLWRKLFGGKL